ncbi:MAG TPA: hypothetical protein EYH22_01645 [Candidatus Nanopusillus sp.]|nr:hypothetical protein [Candidatus Nanopusillus sp.]
MSLKGNLGFWDYLGNRDTMEEKDILDKIPLEDIINEVRKYCRMYVEKIQKAKARAKLRTAKSTCKVIDNMGNKNKENIGGGKNE